MSVMQELFVIYNKNTGFIEGGTGKIDRELDALSNDGSTMFERIPLILAKDKNRAVIYLSNQDVPNSKKYKIIDGRVVAFSTADNEATQIQKGYEEKVDLRIRKIAIDQLKSEGELPQNYSDTQREAVI